MTTTPLVVAEDLAAYLQRDLDRSSAELAIDGAVGAAQTYCRWSLGAEATTFTLDGTGSTVLSLPTLRLVTVDAVRLDGVALESCPAGGGSTVQYGWSAVGQLFRAAGWPKRPRCVEADVVHGYDPLPRSVRLVVLAVAGRLMNNFDGVTSKAVGAVSRGYDSGRPAELSELEEHLLSGYRLP